MHSSLLKLLRQHLKTAGYCRHRTLLILSGNQADALQLIQQIETELPLMDLEYLNRDDNKSSYVQAKALLGTDTGSLVIDAWVGFDPDAFGIASGTIKAGSMCILITPNLNDWHHFKDPENKRLSVYPINAEAISGNYLNRLSRIIRGHTKTLARIDGVQCRLLTSGTSPGPYPISPALPTDDQCRLINRIEQLNSNQNPQILLVTADRGRGKSSALGLAAKLIGAKQDQSQLLVTAPARSAVEILFKHAGLSVTNFIKNQNTTLQFIAPDKLITEQPDCDVLFVDEAAAIPLPMLDKMSNIYPRIVFSSTLFGYEGAGRGFALRFRQMLKLKRLNWQEETLYTPVRYGKNDPLETFTHSLLMLDADTQRPVNPSTTHNTFTLKTYSKAQLLADEDSLRTLFALLVEAHYQTKPLDLRHLLDGPNLKLCSLNINHQPAAALLIATEGRITDTHLQSEILKGIRRPKGHLLPQTLAYQHLQPEFLSLKLARVVRIAVHPEIQQQGYGSEFLSAVEKKLIAEGYEGIGASFGATKELLPYWLKNGYRALHMGFKRNASSASYSLIMFKSFNRQSSKASMLARQRFLSVMSTRQKEQGISSLIGVLAPELSQSTANGCYTFDTEQILLEVGHYAKKHRDFESAKAALTFFFQRHSDHLPHSDNLIKRLIFNSESWNSVSRDENLAGRRQCESIIRDVAMQILANET